MKLFWPDFYPSASEDILVDAAEYVAKIAIRDKTIEPGKVIETPCGGLTITIHRHHVKQDHYALALVTEDGNHPKEFSRSKK